MADNYSSPILGNQLRVDAHHGGNKQYTPDSFSNMWTWLRDNPRYLAFRRDVSDPTSSHERALRGHNRQLELVEANSVPPGLGVSQHEVPRTLLNHHFYP